MRIWDRIRHSLAALGLAAMAAGAAAPRRGARRQARRCGRSPTRDTDHLSVRHRSTCCRRARTGAPPSSTRRRARPARWSSRRSSTRRTRSRFVGELIQPRRSPRPAADRSTASARTSAPRLQAAIAKSGIPQAALDKLETWAAAFMLLGSCSSRSSASIRQRRRRSWRCATAFAAAGKPVEQLETNAEQLGFFDTLARGRAARAARRRDRGPGQGQGRSSTACSPPG